MCVLDRLFFLLLCRRLYRRLFPVFGLCIFYLYDMEIYQYYAETVDREAGRK